MRKVFAFGSACAMALALLSVAVLTAPTALAGGSAANAQSGTHITGPLFVGGVQVGMDAMISPGKRFYCDPGGLCPPEIKNSGNWYSTITAAYAATVAGRGDIVYLVGGPDASGSTSMTVRLTETLVWAKANTHLIGLAAPTAVGGRARITGPSTGGTFSPLISITASGCRFENITVFDDYTVDPVAVKVSGSRNYFNNFNMQGMGAATGADDAAGASLWIAGGQENTFDTCTIGLDTVPRSTTNGEILFTSAATRNVFRDCDIVSYSDNAGHLWVKASGSGDLDRYTNFIRCRFHNAPTGIASGTTMTQGMNIHSSAGGYVLLDNCMMIGATDWAAADNGNVFISNAAPTAGTSGIAVAVTR